MMDSSVLPNKTNDVLEFLFNGTSDIQQSHFSFRRPPYLNVLISMLMLLFALTGIVGNGAVLTVSFTNEILKRQTENVLVAYLSLIDFLFAIFINIPSGIAASADYWPFGDTMCKIQTFSLVTLMTANSGAVASIAAVRLVGVRYPLHYNAWVTRNLMYAIITLLSLVSGFFCVYAMNDLLKYSYAEVACIVHYDTDDFAMSTFFIVMSLASYFPATLIAVLYISLVIEVWRSRNAVQAIFVTTNNRDLTGVIQEDRNLRKAMKSMIFVASVYFVMFTMCIGSITFKKIFKRNIPAYVHTAANCLVTLSCAVNPFIYGFFRKDYRDAFQKLFKSISKRF